MIVDFCVSFQMHTELEELWTVFYHNFSKCAASGSGMQPNGSHW
jgi:hypothetical protein